jgi:hypothetical protein
VTTKLVDEVNRALRGWINYFNVGPIVKRISSRHLFLRSAKRLGEVLFRFIDPSIQS